MSCCEGTSGGLERYPGTGCCGTSCAAGRTGCLASEPRIRTCLCQENTGCLDRADCGGFRPTGTAATGACPGPCQCAEEEAWNRNVPPKPNCEWLSNFSELRRQWSDHGRQNSCKCCNCKPCRTAAPCKPCIPNPPRCSKTIVSDNCQDCCNERLCGGACGQFTPIFPISASRKRDCSPSSAMSGGCPPPNCNRAPPSSCCSPNTNVYTLPCDSPSECSLSNSCSPPPCRPPSSCQPCSPSPRPILKKRSCCQCITGFCLCQPMPRNCNCPPPIQVDARAEHECSCECPSSPECACPPSERKFPTTKVKCPNARMCCPTPRPQPGPKCCCTKCQPCLPPPCDPCTSSKCRTVPPKVKPCCADSPCDERAPCRPESPKVTSVCRPIPPCNDCRKMSPPCRPTSQNGNVNLGARQIRPLSRPRSPDFRCPPPSGGCRSDEGYGDDNGEADTGYRGEQCHCGSSGSRGCDEMCDYCCSLNCDNDADEIPAEPTREANFSQCDCVGRDRRPLPSRRSYSSSSSTSMTSNCSPCTICPCDIPIESSSFHKLFSHLGNIGRTILVPGPVALVSFLLLILVGLTWAFGLALYHRYICAKRWISTRAGTNYRESVNQFITKELGPCIGGSTEQQPCLFQFFKNHHSRCPSSNSYQFPICPNLLYSNSCVPRFSFFELLEYSWQLGRNSRCSCFENSFFNDDNEEFIREFVDVAVGNSNDEIPISVGVATNSESQSNITRCECTTENKKSIECITINSAMKIGVEEFSCEDNSSTISGNPESSIDSPPDPREARRDCCGSKIVCDDDRNVISNIDLRM